MRNAVKARDLVLLRQLVAETKKKKLESGTEDEMKTAEDVITRLEMIRRLTQMIVDMDRQLVAEVKSYLSPRPPVYNVIAATFMLLGEPQANIKVYKGKLYVNQFLRELCIDPRLIRVLSVDPNLLSTACSRSVRLI